MRWIPEIAAAAAALVIALHTDMAWWQFMVLYVALDLMTSSNKLRTSNNPQGNQS